MPYLSIVTPVYHAVNIVDELYRQLVENLEKITNDFEIIMVNDACPQGSGEKIMALAERDPRVKFIDLTRNFGQHIAISAGLDFAEGEYVVVMDCDLQDPPTSIKLLLDKLKQDKTDICFAVREKRKDSLSKCFFAKLFRKILSFFCKKEFYNEEDTCNFSVITRRVVLELRKLREKNRCYPVMLLLTGFSKSFINVEFNSRYQGSSSYTFLKSLKLAYNIMMMGQSGILVMLNAFALFVSCLFCFMSFMGLGYCILVGHSFDTVLILFVFTLFFVMQFTIFHFIILYITGSYYEVLNRPLYFIKRSKNIRREDV